VWKIGPTGVFDRKVKWYQKKKKAELTAVLNNLTTFVLSLRSGRKPKPFAYGFLHAEPSDIIAIDQKGAGSKLAATRLYVYPEIVTNTLYLPTIGGKPSQPADIEDCKRFVAQIKAESPRREGGSDEGEEGDGEAGAWWRVNR